MAHKTAEELDRERLLIQEAQRDRSKFAVLYERYVDQIFAYVFSMTRNRELAEDVTAATFARAYEELPKFQWRGVPYSAWLYRVAGNMVARSRRGPGWVALGDHLQSDTADPMDVVAHRITAAELTALVHRLPPDQREVVMLRFGGELRNKEIAEIIGRSEGAVKLLTFRALTTLRKELGAPLPAERGTATREVAEDA
jgi:RNA polymerase sigma-70 factor (ECF subfamily)